jgi:hypothetical protein
MSFGFECFGLYRNPNRFDAGNTNRSRNSSSTNMAEAAMSIVVTMLRVLVFICVGEKRVCCVSRDR